MKDNSTYKGGKVANDKDFMKKHSVTPEISELARKWDDRAYVPKKGGQS